MLSAFITAEEVLLPNDDLDDIGMNITLLMQKSLLSISVIVVSRSPSCEIDVFRERFEEVERDNSLLSLYDELRGDKYCDEDNIDVEVDTAVADSVAVLEVSVAVGDMDNNEEVECYPHHDICHPLAHHIKIANCYPSPPPQIFLGIHRFHRMEILIPQ
jgi:hypothetical protein